MFTPNAARPRHLPALLLCAVLTASGAAAVDDIPSNVRGELEAVLQERVADLLKEKGAAGVQFKRGAYSRAFKKIDDATYEVSFNQDTVQKSTMERDQMKVERFVLTLKKADGKKWAVADQKLVDTYDSLFRFYLEKDDFYRFDSFAFEREGFRATARNGFLFKFSRKGEPFAFTLVADDLAYTYAPPANLGFYGSAVSHYGIVRDEIIRDRPDDLVFKPLWLGAQCDPKSCEQIYESAFQGLTKLAGGAAEDGGRSGAFGKLRALHDEAVKASEKRDRENAFGGFLPFAVSARGFESALEGFTPPSDPAHRTWGMVLKRDSAKEHLFSIGSDNFEPREVAVVVSGYGPIFRYNAEDVRKSAVSPYDLEARDDSDARDYDLRGVEGTVDVALEDSTRLTGDINYTMYIKRDLNEIYFRISRTRFPGGSDEETKNPKLFVNSIRDGDGNELTWVKLGAYTGLVVFPRPIAGGTVIKLRMQFSNLDSIYDLNPAYSAMDRGGWLPFVRFADMIDKFDLTVRTPAKFQVLGIGNKVADSVKEGVRTTRWVSKSPVSFPTIIFGDYMTDKSKHQATKLDGTPIPVNVWVDRVSMTSLDTNIRSESDAAEFAARMAAGSRDIRGKQLPAIPTQAAVALDLYKDIYGVDYPFDKLDLVADPLGAFYGQAPASIIYLGFGVFRGEGEVAAGNLFGGGASISKFNKDVVAHETAHQWWGSLICNANQGNYWFVESLAELSSALYVEEVFGRKRYLEKVADWRRNILDANPLSNVQDNYTVYGGEPFSPVVNIYNKGPYAFHVLRETFGHEKFSQFLKELAGTLKGKEIVTRDIQQVAEQVYQGNMDWFFDQWIRGVGMPQYALAYTARRTEDGKWLVEGKIKQRVVYGKNTTEIKGQFYRAVAPLTFVAHNGKRFKSKPLLVEGPETSFKLKVADEPAQVIFNEDGEILAQDVLVNRSW